MLDQPLYNFTPGLTVVCLSLVQSSKDYGLDAMLHELCEDDAKVTKTSGYRQHTADLLTQQGR